MDIKYSAVLKNPRRPSAKWYGRIRQDGKERFVPLYTQDKAEAMRWVERQKHILFEIDELEEQEKPVPAELSSRLLTIDTPVFAQNVVQEPVAAPGGILERWETDMTVRGFRKTTRECYVRGARNLLGESSAESLTVDRVRAMFAGKAALADSTRKWLGDAMRSLFTFMGRQELVQAVPRVRVDEESGKRVWYTPEQMMEIWMSVTSYSAEATEQYRNYFRLLVETACRNTEARLLKWKDISNATVRFPANVTKGRKTRTVPITWEFYAELDWIRGEPDDDVFPLVSMNQTRRYKVFKRCIKKLGLEGTLHDLRRSRAMDIYKRSKDIKLASRWLGDSEIVALKHYIEDVDVDKMREIVLGCQ